MSLRTRFILFLLFFVSGFSSLVYQVVWTRMAFASFGIITPVLSVVLSVFMLGLFAGSWMGGLCIGTLVRKTGRSAAMFYACAELVIGLGAFVVPRFFVLGERMLLSAGATNSAAYLSRSALVLACSILPWCFFMGATFPFMMAYVREREKQSAESFSFLYVANVFGAMSGTLLTAVVLIEALGFRRTLWVAAAGNFGIALVSLWLGARRRGHPAPGPTAADRPAPAAVNRSPAIKWTLFATGFSAMAMEVVWTRAFCPVLRTQVYSFASIVFTYLGATWLGSFFYRRDLRTYSVVSTAGLVAALAFSAFLPVIVNDARFVDVGSTFDRKSAIMLLASICPLCGVLGYLTPRLIDAYAAGNPADAGKAYAINVLGCILGPLAASYLLLPFLSERHVLILLSAPILLAFLAHGRALPRRNLIGCGLGLAVLLGGSTIFTEDYEGYMMRFGKGTQVRHDYAASVVATEVNNRKRLYVNGVGMTGLSSITKFMIHLPLAYHEGKSKSALVICFGMGTTFRSGLSWDIDVTTVELVPSVVNSFGAFHANAAQVMADPHGHVVIDDGRRFLKRTREKYDIIVIDPPPPVEAAGSSLLYSDEFYELAKEHLNPHGILQTWFPGGERTIGLAILRSLNDSFRHVRCFASIAGWGNHMLASDDPIEDLSAAELAARMPPAAVNDLMEWATNTDVTSYIQDVLSQESPVAAILDPNPAIRITDARPYNEYFLLRRLGVLPGENVDSK